MIWFFEKVKLLLLPFCYCLLQRYGGILKALPLFLNTFRSKWPVMQTVFEYVQQLFNQSHTIKQKHELIEAAVNQQLHCFVR